ncbi:hypothetical protein [Dechloromonas hortensis]|uniref:hypothetical protein n=1 Tax=Dechloromonas hortensis TaxID=337779 RepID=UPI001292854C|nr:hypothetical protein [Dechloromonas hortensis]
MAYKKDAVSLHFSGAEKQKAHQRGWAFRELLTTPEKLERQKSLELSTYTLARYRSTN